MRIKRIIICLLPLILVWILAGIILVRRDKARSAVSIEHFASKVKPQIDQDQVDHIQLKWRQAWIVDLKRDATGKWIVVQRGNKADPERITRFLDLLRRMPPLKIIRPADKKLLTRLRINPDETDQKAIPGVRVTIRAKGKTVCDMMLGRGHFIAENDLALPVAKNVPDGRYLGCIHPDGTVTPFLTATLFEEIHPMPGTWLKMPAIGRLAQIRWIRFDSAKTPPWILQRKDYRSPFICTRPKGYLQSPQDVKQLLGLLRGSFVADSIRVKDNKLKMESLGTLSLSDGKTYTIQFFKSEGKMKEYFVRFSSDPEFFYLIAPQVYEIVKKVPAAAPVKTKR